jgi:hypothetical protein
MCATFVRYESRSHVTSFSQSVSLSVNQFDWCLAPSAIPESRVELQSVRKLMKWVLVFPRADPAGSSGRSQLETDVSCVEIPSMTTTLVTSVNLGCRRAGGEKARVSEPSDAISPLTWPTAREGFIGYWHCESLNSNTRCNISSNITHRSRHLLRAEGQEGLTVGVRPVQHLISPFISHQFLHVPRCILHNSPNYNKTASVFLFSRNESVVP